MADADARGRTTARYRHLIRSRRDLIPFTRTLYPIIRGTERRGDTFPARVRVSRSSAPGDSRSKNASGIRRGTQGSSIPGSGVSEHHQPSVFGESTLGNPASMSAILGQ